MKKVFVSGCFDLFHSGHVEFLNTAANYGQLYVGLGSDKTVRELKNRDPFCNQTERLFIVSNIKCVHKAFINSGHGKLDFISEVEKLSPDYFIVNSDGDVKEKRDLCTSLGINYVVLERKPHGGLIPRSSTDIRKLINNVPYRIDLAGGWLDQPSISSMCPGSVITVSIEPTFKAQPRSGLCSSTRNIAELLSTTKLNIRNQELFSKMLFCLENEPDKKLSYLSGAQDSIGVVYRGFTNQYYDNKYWPNSIQNITDKDIAKWFEQHSLLIETKARKDDYNVLKKSNIKQEACKKLAESADKCWEGLTTQNLEKYADAVTQTYESQKKIFPQITTNNMEDNIQKILLDKNVLGAKAVGAGGGGYIYIVCKDIEKTDGIKLKVRI